MSQTENQTQKTEPAARARNSSARNILTVMGGTLASRLLGLVRQTLFNKLFSVETTDAFNVAFRVPNLFRELLAEGALTNAIIPVYKSLAPESRKQFASSLLGVLLAVNAIIVGLGIVFAPKIVSLLQVFAHVSGKQSSLNEPMAIMLTRLVMPFLAGISFSALAMALLNAEEKFSTTAFAPLAFNIITIAGFLIFPRNAPMLGLFTALGGFAQLLVQLPELSRANLMPVLSFAPHPALSRAITLMGPFAFTTSTRQFLNVVFTGVLSGFPPGAQTGFANADTIFQLCLGLFAVSPALAAYPRLAEQAVAKDWPAFRATVSNNLRLILFLSAPVSVLLFVLAPYAATTLFDLFGLIEKEKFEFTRQATPALAAGIVPWGLSAFLVRSFYVRERSRDAIVVSVVGVLTTAILYLVFVPFGFAVLSAAPAISGWLVVGMYAFLLQRQVGLDWRSLLRFGLQVALATIAAGGVAAIVSGFLPVGRGLLRGLSHLLLAGGVGLLVYVALAVWFGWPEIGRFASRFRIKI